MKKGMGLLFLLGSGIVMFILVNIIIVGMIFLVGGDVQSLYFISQKINTEGKEINALLLADIDMPYINAIGYRMAEGGETIVESTTNLMKDSIERIGKKCLIVYSGVDLKKPDFTVGTCPEGEIVPSSSQVPIPGARKEKTSVMVMLS